MIPVSSRKRCPSGGGRPIQRAPRTRRRCPCAKTAISPSIARTRSITRSTRRPTCSGVSPPGHPLRNHHPPRRSCVDLRLDGEPPRHIPRSSTRRRSGSITRLRHRVPRGRKSRGPAAEGCDGARARRFPWPGPAAIARPAAAHCLCRSAGYRSCPVCCPLRLHSVSPCLVRRREPHAHFMRASDVVRLGRTGPCGRRLARLPGPVGDVGHVVADAARCTRLCSMSLSRIACLA